MRFLPRVFKLFGSRLKDIIWIRSSTIFIEMFGFITLCPHMSPSWSYHMVSRQQKANKAKWLLYVVKSRHIVYHAINIRVILKICIDCGSKRPELMHRRSKIQLFFQVKFIVYDLIRQYTQAEISFESINLIRQYN